MAGVNNLYSRWPLVTISTLRSSIILSLLLTISSAVPDTSAPLQSSEVSTSGNNVSAIRIQLQNETITDNSSGVKVESALSVVANNTDNDLLYPLLVPQSQVDSKLSHVEAREEADNRIADAQLSSLVPLNSSSSSSKSNFNATSKSSRPVPSDQLPAVTGPASSVSLGDSADAADSQVPKLDSAAPIATENSELPPTTDVNISSVALKGDSKQTMNASSRSINDGKWSPQSNSPQDSTGSKTDVSKGFPENNMDELPTKFANSSMEEQNVGQEIEAVMTTDEVLTSEVPDEITEIPTTDSAMNTNIPSDKLESFEPSASNTSESSGSEHEVHECARECVAGEAPKRCYYHFEVAGFYAMSKACYDCPRTPEDCDLPDCVAADGVPRGLVVVNRMLPGPAIEVCLGDTIVVDLHNGLVAETTSVHWHGHHQRGTQYMDGVPHVTQCPIPPMTSFRYTFVADTPGTHFWHSHTGHQRADGAFGSLVVRVPRAADATAALWDRDERAHSLLVLDWGSAGGAERFLAHHHARGPNKPTALLVNGRGRVPPSPPPPPGLGPQPGDPLVPAPEFIVHQGLRYRFRLINAGFLNCPIELSVDDHDLLVIASDGGDVRPVPAVSLVSYAGERFDFVINANQSVGVYWIRLRGLLDCDERFNSVHQAAVLRYEGASENEPLGELSYETAHRPGHQVNSFNVGSGTPGSTVIPELDALVPDDESLKEEPDFRFYLAYDFYPLDNPHFHKAPYYGFYNVTDVQQRTFTPQFNHLSMKMPPVPMLPQREELDQEQFCNASSVAGKGCEGKYCECAHVIQIPLNSVMELILIDEGVPYDANHPFHLHGYAFRVVAMQRLGNSTSLDEVRRLDEQGLIPRKLHAAPLKDTCTVPDGGFTILRVRANNPGYWLFHCHIEFHVEIGMALVFKIGEHSEFPPVPKGFPRCGNWIPDDDVEAIAIPSNGELGNKGDKDVDARTSSEGKNSRLRNNRLQMSSHSIGNVFHPRATMVIALSFFVDICIAKVLQR